MTSPRLLRAAGPAGLLITGLLAPTASWASCSEFFDTVALEFGGSYETPEQVSALSEIQGHLATWYTVEEGAFLAIEYIGPDDAEVPDIAWNLVGQRVAICSDSPWRPPAITLNANSGIALNQPLWDSAAQAGPTGAMISSRGRGVYVVNATFDLPNIEGADNPTLIRLVDLSRDGSTSGSPLTYVAALTVLSKDDERATLVGHAATSVSGGCSLTGTIDLYNIDWQDMGVADGQPSMIYRPFCINSSSTETTDLPDSTSDVDLYLEGATLQGPGAAAAWTSPLALAPGELVLSTVDIGGFAMTEAPLFAARDRLVAHLGSAFSDLNGDGTWPAFYVEAGDFTAQQVLFNHVTGFEAVAEARNASIGGGYLCGVAETGSVLRSNADSASSPAPALELVSSVVSDSHFWEALLAGSSLSTAYERARISNVLFAGVQAADGGHAYLVDGGLGNASTALVNILGYNSLIKAGTNVEADTAQVRFWDERFGNGESACAYNYWEEGCEDLVDQPDFTAPDPDSAALCSELAPDLAQLMRNEALGTPDEDLIEALHTVLPILYDDQEKLLDQGLGWASSDTFWSDCDGLEDDIDIGAYGGSCRLEFLAPAATDDEPEDTGSVTEPGDSGGGVDTASPDDLTAAGTLGFGGGCRYGFGAAVLLLPFGAALGRRRQRAAGSASDS